MNSIREFLLHVQGFLSNSVFQAFRDPTVAIGLSLLILVAGVAFTLWLILLKWLPFSRRLKKLATVVRATEGELGFARDFPTVDEQINRVPVVRHGWSEFKETLVIPETDNQPIQNTARPMTYINIAEAETSGLHIKFFQAVPNYFVGIGLLLTFIGLVAAIYFASSAIDGNATIDRTQERLRDLLSAATFKFLTSIAGIFSSLLVAIFYRLVVGNLQKHFDNLCEALEQRLIFATAESIAFNQYKELQKQTIQLERFNTDFAFSVAKELDSRITASLQTALENALAPLTTTMNNMADRFGEMNQDAMSSMINSFTQKLQQGAGAEMQALSATLAETKNSLGSLSGALQSASAQLDQTLSAAGHRLETAASKMEQSVQEGLSASAKELKGTMEQIASAFNNQFTESTAKFAGAIRGVSRDAEALLQPMQAHLQTLTDRLDQLSVGLGAQMQSIGRLNTELGTLVQNTAAASDRLKNAGQPVQRASEAIGIAAQRIVESTKVAGETHRQLAELASQVRQAVEKTTQVWSDYQTRFKEVDQDLAITFQKLSDGTAEQQSSIKSFVSSVDQQLDKALRSLAAGVEGLQDNIEDFTAAVDNLGEKLGGTSR